MDYKNGVIYKICCKDKDITDCYVGSSCSHISRKSSHKSNCNNKNSREYNYPVYRYIRDNGGWGNWEFVLLEEYPCENKNQLVIRERYWFEKLGATLNKRYPERSKTEYYQENKEEILEKRKEYHKQNREKISEKGKEHYQKNKVEILEKAKENYQKNKVECECGSIVCRKYLKRHKKTQKHQKNLQKLSESKSKK